MIDAVFIFGALNVLFEFVLISMVTPRWRLRLLGNEGACTALHVFFLAANLAIHWGTLIGTMSSVLSFVSSIVTVRVARAVFGTVTEGRYYRVGWIKYSREELV